jgi:hypothetical protein
MNDTEIFAVGVCIGICIIGWIICCIGLLLDTTKIKEGGS